MQVVVARLLARQAAFLGACLPELEQERKRCHQNTDKRGKYNCAGINHKNQKFVFVFNKQTNNKENDDKTKKHYRGIEKEYKSQTFISMHIAHLIYIQRNQKSINALITIKILRMRSP